MLTDMEILRCMERGEIVIEPFKEKNLGSNSYDLRIAGRVRSFKFNNGGIDLSKQHQYNYLDTNLPYTITPGETILFITQERVGCMRETIGLLSPRSNLARSGLIFQFSNLLDTGFNGVLSGTIHNPTNACITIPENLRIMQIMFDYNTGELKTPYNERKWSKNVGQANIEDAKYKPDKEFLMQTNKNYSASQLKVSDNFGRN